MRILKSLWGNVMAMAVLLLAATAAVAETNCVQAVSSNAVESLRPLRIKFGNVQLRSAAGIRRSGVNSLIESIRARMPELAKLYGDPYAAGLKNPPYEIKIEYQADNPGDGGYHPSYSEWRIWTGNRGDIGKLNFVDQLCACCLYFSPEPNWAAIVAYANAVNSSNGVEEITRTIAKGRELDPDMTKYDWCGRPETGDVKFMHDAEYYHPIRRWRTYLPLEELRSRRPSILNDYFAAKIRKGMADQLYMRMTIEQEMDLFCEVMEEDVIAVFAKYRWPGTNKRY